MTPLEPEKIYHIYNRANGDDWIFSCKWNYLFFLDKFKLYLLPVCEVYAYCLLPNHFHFLLRIKEEKELNQFFSNSDDPAKIKNKTSEQKLSKQFSNFFSCYTQAFNKKYSRRGSLFMKNFKRKNVSDLDYLIRSIIYIHQNPVKARICLLPEDWNYSSYKPIIKKDESDITNIYATLSLFESIENFIYCHQHPTEL